ncbi:MAG: tryptophan halogenase [Dehalococcoidia bacterium]|nr:tryptophan halogenase [Dehalococcoidia bacterium]HCV00715.1 tryptophan halogenase [Dehalococcoidia bacterium]|tara:strand:+ start:5786 stop:7420 length:1635 start_codon:yes stop_codon:yes gene_type:complete
MRDNEYDTDVVVVGGGPAGSAAATMLSRKGWGVRLYERNQFPREHVGESLLPASMPILAELGVLPAIEAAGFLPKYGATMVWGREPDPWSWSFRESSPRYPHAFQVVRAQFDEILLRNASKNGVDVRERHRVLYADAGPSGANLRIEDDALREHTIRARFVIDASGQSGLIAHARSLRKPDPFFHNLAIYGYYTGGARLPEPDANNILIESIKDGWLWVIPLHTGLASVGVVVDSSFGRKQIAKLGVQAFFREQIANGPHTSTLLEDATLTTNPTVVRDWSYTSGELAGEGFVLAGDAACFVDPLFSSGVHLALSSGVLAAAYVTSALTDPKLGRAAAAVYSENYLQQYHHFRELARLFYSSNRTVDSYFWETRRITGADDSTPSRLAFIRAVAGQPPAGYERAVLAHGETPRSFSEAVTAIEGYREARGTSFDKRFGSDFPLLLTSRPSLVPETRLEQKPVAGEGEFTWGQVIITPERAEGVPVSTLVALVVAQIDGKRTVNDLFERLRERIPQETLDQLRPGIAQALRLLHVEGVIANFDDG